ncbi:class A beta-lactamase [Pseudoxanthomonas wuyuanensis]|uniref:Beta-lactamase n=1 Tax=Pseudoxanthomonas wuyuanensis TaxID=1073196 RepID=A0A286CYI4_9GAMM|nr:class A beta-lactamase [Pseudoxanthomonas wuyuanensis]KAF1722747.1 class A beta-lactamase [Pseudoxanthomonas wuyuanensis]SOD51465.1 beta-lactamase class A [Pseudoxanthomonas wuyuanensis]
MIERRDFLRAAIAALALAGFGAKAGAAREKDGSALPKRLRAIEKDSGGRLGVAVLDSGSGQQANWRGDERFAMCSTFKFLLAAAVLARVEKGEEALERRIPILASDLVSHSPVTEKLVGGEGASIAQLCEATMIVSDNAAANLLLPLVGGPEGLTRFVRTLGDTRTRLDRTEPSLNSAIPGDPRDTTTPLAMLHSMQRLLLGDALADASRQQLLVWLRGNLTGDNRLRAGLPAGWQAGDKTGTANNGSNGTSNDIAILWPPGRAPLLLTCYLTESPLASAARDGIHKAVAAAVVEAVA